MEQRLQKLLASAGIASRRSCEALIAAGRVTVNGKKVTEAGTKADPEVDDIRLDGKPIPKTAEHIYIVLNKPTGYVTTVSDPHAAHTVMELVQGVGQRVYPVGRLDADSAGLLILSNDGDFTERMTHPSHQVPKTYRAVVRGEVPEWAGADLSKGILLEDGMTAPAKVEWVDYDEANNASIIDITIHEGRNRQVRRMFDAVGYRVLALTRMSIGPVVLRGLAPGTWRKLSSTEVKALLDAADSTPPSLPQVPKEEQPASPAAARAPSPARAGRTERPSRPQGRETSPTSAGRQVKEIRSPRAAAPMRQQAVAAGPTPEADILAAARALTRELEKPDPEETTPNDRPARGADRKQPSSKSSKPSKPPKRPK